MRPNLDEDQWELENIEDAHQRNPTKFQIPSVEERTHLRVGDLAKLVFLFVCEDEEGPYVQGERMHVTVTEVNDAGYSGTLEDIPQSSEVLSRGDTVHFGPEHVATIIIRRTDPRHPAYQGERKSDTSSPRPLTGTESGYLTAINNQIEGFKAELAELAVRNPNPSPQSIQAMIAILRKFALAAPSIQVPDRFNAIHSLYLGAAQHLGSAAEFFEQGVKLGRQELLLQAQQEATQGRTGLDSVQLALAAAKQ